METVLTEGTAGGREVGPSLGQSWRPEMTSAQEPSPPTQLSGDVRPTWKATHHCGHHNAKRRVFSEVLQRRLGGSELEQEC